MGHLSNTLQQGVVDIWLKWGCYVTFAGEVLASFGAGEFYMPHMITMDTSGNMWTTDVGKQVATKWSPTGKKLMELGTPMEPGNDRTHFCKPTQVCRIPLHVN